jgi:hypothetical protein
LPGPAQAGPEHDLGQPGELAGVLGDRDEVRRRDRAVRGVLPTGQALDADHPPVGERDLGLEVDLDLARLQRAAHVAGEGEPVGRPGLQGRAEDVDRRGELLGRLGREVRPAQQHLGLRAVIRMYGDTDRDIDVERDRADLHRALQALAQPVGQASGLIGAGQSDEDRELVAAGPADLGRGGREAPEPFAHLADHAVAGVMAQRVVHVAHAVDVEDQHGHDLVRRPYLDRLFEHREQAPPVGQAGEGVVVRVEPQPLDQARVLDGDSGVGGKRLQQANVGRPELRQVAEASGHFQ